MPARPSTTAPRKVSRKPSGKPPAAAGRRATATQGATVNGNAEGERRRPGRKPDPLGRDKLLKAAAQAFMDRGYVGTSIDDIAELLGVTKGFFYHHFSSKAELYFAVIENATRRIDDAVREVFEQDLPADMKIERMAERHALVLMENFAASKVGVQGLEKSLFRSAGATERNSLRRFINMRDRYEGMFRDTIRQGIAAGLFRDESLGLATRAMLGALNWMTMWFDPNRLTTAAKRKAMARQLAEFATHGLKP